MPCAQILWQFRMGVVIVEVADEVAVEVAVAESVDVAVALIVVVMVLVMVVVMVAGRQRSKVTGQTAPSSPAHTPGVARLWHSPDVPNLHTLSGHWNAARVLATVVVVLVLVVLTMAPCRHATNSAPQVSLLASPTYSAHTFSL